MSRLAQFKMRAWVDNQVKTLSQLTLQQLRQVIQDPDTYKLTRTTGIRDKNGTEIYEGDICEVLYGNPPEIIQGVIRWQDTDQAFMFDSLASKGSGKLAHYYNDLKIVRSVYTDSSITLERG